MQEGTLALMQLAKTLAALERLRPAGVPFISVLSDPTTGGVFASFAAVGDVNIAEPNALIGFAGARVPAGTIAQELPEGFQRAEFLFRHGFVDRVVARPELRDELVGAPAAPAGPRRGDRRDGRRVGPARLPAAVVPLDARRPRRRARGRRDSPDPGILRRRERRCHERDADERQRSHGRRRLGARPAGAQPAAAAHARVRRGDDRRVRRAPRRPPVRRRRGDGRRARPARRPAGRGRRPAEGRRHRREHPAQLRDAASRGLPQGDAPDGAGRAVRPAGRHLRRRPGRPSRTRSPRSAASPRRSPARSR